MTVADTVKLLMTVAAETIPAITINTENINTAKIVFLIATPFILTGFYEEFIDFITYPF